MRAMLRDVWPRPLWLLLSAALASCQPEPPSPPPPGDAPVEWPNQESRANSDRWLVEHHDEIDVMRPKILVLNFVNGDTQSQAHDLVERVNAGLVESSRPRGYQDVEAAPALIPEVFAVVDLRDDPAPEAPRRNSSLYPREDPVDGYWGFDYEALFTAPPHALHRGGLSAPLDEQNPRSRPLLVLEKIDGQGSD